VSVTVTHEPGATEFGGRLRGILLDSPDGALTPRAEALLFAADRAQHVDTVVRPALDRGDVVITDRFIDSSLAYQGAGRALPVEDVRRLSRWATNGLVADLTVLLDVEPELGLRRAGERTGNGDGRSPAPDRLERESVEFHRRVRQAFRALADAAPDRYLVVDGSRHPEAVASIVRSAVGKRLAAHRTDRGGRGGRGHRVRLPSLTPRLARPGRRPGGARVPLPAADPELGPGHDPGHGPTVAPAQGPPEAPAEAAEAPAPRATT